MNSVPHLRHSSLTELKGTHTQANHIFANLSDLENSIILKTLEKQETFYSILHLKKKNEIGPSITEKGIIHWKQDL